MFNNPSNYAVVLILGLVYYKFVYLERVEHDKKLQKELQLERERRLEQLQRQREEQEQEEEAMVDGRVQGTIYGQKTQARLNKVAMKALAQSHDIQNSRM
jgi:hypothetical protein